MKNWVCYVHVFLILFLTAGSFAQNEPALLDDIADKQVSVETPEDNAENITETAQENETEVAQEATVNDNESVEPADSLSNEPQVVVEETQEIVNEPTDELSTQASDEDEQVQEPKEEAEDDEIVGIDTIDLNEPQGNWLFKRHWWERAEKKYEKIRDQVARILEARMSFFKQRSTIDRNLLDPFYLQIGLDQASLEYVISELLGNIVKQREKEGMLEDYEREWLDQLTENQTTLEQIKLNAQAINKVDHDVDDALDKLMQQVNRAREYEREAWNYFKEIARVLNDKRARELVMRMKNISRNVKQLHEYLQAQFTPYYHKLINNIKEKTAQIKLDIDLLKENGVDLKQQMDQLKNRTTQSVEDGVETEKVERKEKQEESGFLTRYIIAPLANIFSMVWSGIVYVIKIPYNLLFGQKKQTAPEDSEIESEVAVAITEQDEE